MEQTRELIAIYNTEIIMGLLAAFFVLLALYLIAEIRISKLKRRYDELVRGSDGINIEELLLKSGYEIEEFRGEISNISKEMDDLQTKLTFAIQKVGFIRYNAFADMGSELSFSIVFLDNFLNGIVLTSIYGREQSTCYAKPIKNGKSVYPLSTEEMQAVDRAIRGENFASSL
jgi:predicted ester cyclase